MPRTKVPRKRNRDDLKDEALSKLLKEFDLKSN